MPNRLIHETSPYLLQHANNPVDWYPWGEEAFEKARREGKPILLSIGYAACHWCHVMAHESFEDPDIAAFINEHFVPVKVDREERPDVDNIYMNAVQAMVGHGGWPLTVFLTPDGVPFYGGTYFPKTPRHGLPSFISILQRIAELWETRREEIISGGEQVLARVASVANLRHQDALSQRILEMAAERIEGNFDPTYGGFGQAPKFPQPLVLEALLRMSRRFQDEQLEEMVGLTLQRMRQGGMYDQIGGGFHRYSVDAIWLVPHFEKMLYDNALLPRVYLHYWQLTQEEAMLDVVHETLTYVLREMQHPEGGFYSSQDADSEGIEGKFYTWTDKEINEVLDPALARIVKTYYDVRPGGNFEGRSILYVPHPDDVVAQRLGMSTEALRDALQTARKQMYDYRAQRVWPLRDEKIQASWNGMMIATLAEAGRVLKEPLYVEAAQRAADFILHNLLDETGRLWHTYKDGKRTALGYLDDYGNMIDALLRLYEATFDVRWFTEARVLAQHMIDLFWEPDAGLFYDTGRDQERLVVRPRDVFDNAYPSGNSLAADVFIRLGALTGEAEWHEYARAILQSSAGLMREMPTGFGHLLCVLDMYLGPMKEIAIVGPLNHPDTDQLIEAAFRAYAPNKVVALLDPAHEAWAKEIPLLAHRTMVNGKPAAYVCENFTCQMPITAPEALGEALEAS